MLEQLENFAAERRHSVTELAFAWLLANPVVRSVTAGATRPEQVEANAKACEWTLSGQDREALRALL